MATTVKFQQNEIVISNNGRVKTLPIANFVALDPSFNELAAIAQNNPGTEIKVPDTTNARGLRPRNYGVYGIQQ